MSHTCISHYQWKIFKTFLQYWVKNHQRAWSTNNLPKTPQQFYLRLFVVLTSILETYGTADMQRWTTDNATSYWAEGSKKRKGASFPASFLLFSMETRHVATPPICGEKGSLLFPPQPPPTPLLWLQYQMHSLTMPSHWIGEGDLKEVVIFRQESFHYGCQTCGEEKRVNNKKGWTGKNWLQFSTNIAWVLSSLVSLQTPCTSPRCLSWPEGAFILFFSQIKLDSHTDTPKLRWTICVFLAKWNDNMYRFRKKQPSDRSSQ